MEQKDKISGKELEQTPSPEKDQVLTNRGASRQPASPDSPSAEPEKEERYKLGRYIALGLIALLVLLYFVWPGYQNFMKQAWAHLSSGDVDQVIIMIREYKEWAAAISFFLMVFQSILAPIPAFLITLANASIFGWWQGAILSWSSAMAGAALCFYIARFLGRDVVQKFTGKGALAAVEKYFEDYGAKTILVARLLPFISFDIVSYIAGLTPINFWAFFIATGIGQLPATIVYSYVGGTLTGGPKYMMLGLLTLFALAILISIGKRIYVNYKNEQAADTGEHTVNHQ